MNWRIPGAGVPEAINGTRRGSVLGIVRQSAVALAIGPVQGSEVMPLHVLSERIVIGVVVLAVSGCSTPNPNTEATASSYEQVKVGMSREEVYALLGEPRSTEPVGDVEHCRSATWSIPHGSHGWGHWTVTFTQNTVTGVKTGHATVSGFH